MIALIKALYTTLIIVTVVNAIITFYCLLSKKDTPEFMGTRATDAKAVWTWKDTCWLVLMIISSVLIVIIAFLLAAVYKMQLFAQVIMLPYFLGCVARAFPSAKIVGDIVNSKTNSMLGKNEYVALLALAFLIGQLNAYGVLNKIIELIAHHPNPILSDWLMLGFSVTSSAIAVFFICSLALRPIKVLIWLLKKICLRFSNQQEPLIFNKLKKYVNGTFKSRTWTSSLICYSIKKHIVLRILLCLGVPITIAIDILQMIIITLLGFAASVVWYLICIIKSIGKRLCKIENWILSLSDRKAVAVFFRIASILGLGCTVIINKYEPFLRSEESASIFEFISSTIIIPIILEWVISYKTK